MNKTQSALERVIIELDSWCDNWTPTSYNDPRISLRQIADRARNVLDPRKKMTDFQPTPQTPEQVADGLREAFRQAKEDGVMDATPYLNQMNPNREIELLKQEIKMLQSKLSFLDELEKTKSPVEEAYKDWWGQYPELETDSEYDDMRWRGFQAGFQAAYEEKVREDDYYDKSQPRMYFELGGKFEIVSYNGENYYRLEYPTDVIWYKKKKPSDGMMLVRITDGETHRLLEGLWFNDVKKGKYDADEPYCPDEPPEYDEIEHDISENIENKTIRDVIDRWWIDTFTSKNMWSVNECIDDLADQIEFWILRNKK